MFRSCSARAKSALAAFRLASATAISGCGWPLWVSKRESVVFARSTSSATSRARACIVSNSARGITPRSSNVVARLSSDCAISAVDSTRASEGAGFLQACVYRLLDLCQCCHPHNQRRPYRVNRALQLAKVIQLCERLSGHNLFTNINLDN